MSDQSKKSNHPTLPGMTNATSSLELADGAKPCDLLDGEIGQSGLEVVHVSHIQQQGKAKAITTLEISGPISSGSSESVNLTRFLVSKLKERFVTVGSMEYVETWKQKVTPLGIRYWAHTALAHRTSDKDSTGWVTPVVGDASKIKPFHGSPQPALAYQSHLATGAGCIPPRARGDAGGNREEVKNLEDQVRLLAVSAWPTPQVFDATDCQSSPEALARRKTKGGCSNLREVVMGSWGTPTTHDAKVKPVDGFCKGNLPTQPASASSGETINSSTVETENRGALNPAFSLWLMGFRSSWLMVAPTKASREQKFSEELATQ